MGETWEGEAGKGGTGKGEIEKGDTRKGEIGKGKTRKGEMEETVSAGATILPLCLDVGS